MPKKGVKNAYFYFMIDFREQEKKKGITFANMQEVQQASDPVWREASAAVRAKYERIVKEEKARQNKPNQKFTTFGVPFSELENQERLVKEASDRELQYIQNLVFQSSIGKKYLDQTIYVVDVNALCETNAGYVFGEFAVIRFNIRNGVIDNIHRIINPPQIPVGYASDIRVGCETFALEVPDPDAPKSDYVSFLSLLASYLREANPDSNVLPPIFTMPEKEDQVVHFIGQLCNKTMEDEGKYRVYKLDILFFYLINTIKTHEYEGLPKESLALAALRKDAFKYTQGIGCAKHEAGERPVECCLARATRWVYTILDSCCPLAGITAIPGQHLPANVDIEAVIAYKEKKMAARGYPHAGPPSVSSRASSVNDSYESFSQATASSLSRPPPATPQRTLTPLRRPTVETLQFQSSLVAPELSSNSEFPPLSMGAGAGRGSGRNLSSKMQNLNLNK